MFHFKDRRKPGLHDANYMPACQVIPVLFLWLYPYMRRLKVSKCYKKYKNSLNSYLCSETLLFIV